jgi:hypothetical protein
LLPSASLKKRAHFQGYILQNKHVSAISGMSEFPGFYPLTGGKVPGALNSTVVPNASPTAKPIREPW